MTSGADEQIAQGPGPGKILLIGDVGSAFLDPHAVAGRGYEVCANVPDAIDAAAKNSFVAIAVVISAIPARLSETLKSLRDRCDAKIILLAQMYEEPEAIQLVNSAHNGAKLANDYVICPVQPDTLYESVTAANEKWHGHLGRVFTGLKPVPHQDRQTEPPVSALIETTIETRIRNLERLATEDDLTGLKNRRYIREFARQIIKRASRENGQVTLLVFDIDDFKRYNDLYGHSTGDDILRQAAVLVRRCCRGHDVVGRIGGDEFAVVFWDDPRRTPAKTTERRSASADHPTEVISIAKRFIKELESAELSCSGSPCSGQLYSDKSLRRDESSLDGLGPEGKGVLTISGGLASFPRDGQTNQELFQQADKALLEAKRSGKNRIYLVGKPQNDIADIK